MKPAKLSIVCFFDPSGHNSKQQFMDLERAFVRLRSKGLQVIGVVSKADEARKTAYDLMITFPILVDDTKRMERAYKVTMTPFAVVLNPHREVQYVQVARVVQSGINRLRQYAEQELTGNVSYPLFEDPKHLLGKTVDDLRIRDIQGKVWSSRGDKPYDLLFLLSEYRESEAMIKAFLRMDGPELVVAIDNGDPSKIHHQMRLWTDKLPGSKRRVRFINDINKALGETFLDYTYPSLIQVDGQGRIRRVLDWADLEPLIRLSPMPR